jgi:hypothetical protein
MSARPTPAAAVAADDQPPDLRPVPAVTHVGAVELHGAHDVFALGGSEQRAFAGSELRRRVGVRRTRVVARERCGEAERHPARVSVEQELRELVQVVTNRPLVQLVDPERHALRLDRSARLPRRSARSM